MIKVFSIVLFIILYNFDSYCGCCGYCCVDPKLEIQRRFDEIKIEDKDILNKNDGYKDTDYDDIAKIEDVQLVLKDPPVTSKLNFNSIIKGDKYFNIFYDLYLSNIKEKEWKTVFEEGYKAFTDKIVKDIGDKADFNYTELGDFLVFETSFSFKKSKYSSFKSEILTNSENYNKLLNIICGSHLNKGKFKIYFESRTPLNPINLRKQKGEYQIIFDSNSPNLEGQDINKLEKLGDAYFLKMNFTYIVNFKTVEFFILLNKKQYDKMIDDYNKTNPT